MWRHPRYRGLTGREPPARDDAQAKCPPTEQGERLATFPRRPDAELRVCLAAYEGKPYVSLRVWRCGSDGLTCPPKTEPCEMVESARR